jgi:hypothetical protein
MLLCIALLLCIGGDGHARRAEDGCVLYSGGSSMRPVRRRPCLKRSFRFAGAREEVARAERPDADSASVDAPTASSRCVAATACAAPPAALRWSVVVSVPEAGLRAGPSSLDRLRCGAASRHGQADQGAPPGRRPRAAAVEPGGGPAYGQLHQVVVLEVMGEEVMPGSYFLKEVRHRGLEPASSSRAGGSSSSAPQLPSLPPHQRIRHL